MPSSPETAVLESPRWDPPELDRSAQRAATQRPSSPSVPLAASGWSFERAFPAEPRTSPAPFSVAIDAGVPDAVLDEARRAAQAAGYAAGYARGAAEALRSAQADHAEAQRHAERAAAAARHTVARAAAALDAAASQLAARSAGSLAEIEQLLVGSVYDVAEAVVGAVVRDDPRRGAAALTRVLALVPDDTDVTVALHPDDHDAVTAAGVVAPAGVRLVPDATLLPGDAVATSGATTVDARIAAGLARVREVLGR